MSQAAAPEPESFPGTFPNARALARRGGPETSEQGAVHIVAKIGRAQRFAFTCVQLTPGWTQRELDYHYAPGKDRTIGKRLNEIEAQGLVRRGEARLCRITGQMADTWWPVETDPDAPTEDRTTQIGMF